ncbi:MAG: DHH family phosphoesterase [Candidatus Saccharimonadales bacterium]
MEEQIKQLIEKAVSILVTSHISPDPDAVSSALLIGETLKLNYPDKKVQVVLEEKLDRDLDFLAGFNEVDFSNLAAAVQKFKPDLFIITDANTYKRVSRLNSEDLKKYIESNKVKTAIIDHHEPHDKEQTDVFINNGNPAAVQDVYETFFKELGFKKPEGYVDMTLLGIISDSLRFKYKNARHRETFAIVSDLIDAGGDIEALEAKLASYTKDQLEVFAHLALNFRSANDYNYTFVSDEFAKKWQTAGKSPPDFKSGCEIFVNQYIRDVAPNTWGFVVYQDMQSVERSYAVSLRSRAGSKDVSLIGKELGGGGHKPAAGARFQANSVEDAVAKVKEAITESVS